MPSKQFCLDCPDMDSYSILTKKWMHAFSLVVWLEAWNVRCFLLTPRAIPAIQWFSCCDLSPASGWIDWLPYSVNWSIQGVLYMVLCCPWFNRPESCNECLKFLTMNTSHLYAIYPTIYWVNPTCMQCPKYLRDFLTQRVCGFLGFIAGTEYLGFTGITGTAKFYRKLGHNSHSMILMLMNSVYFPIPWSLGSVNLFISWFLC